MRRAVRWIGYAAVAGFLALAAGCAPNANFVYKPNPAAVSGGKLPAKVAVLPFTDGTKNFTQRGSIFGGQYNLAKTGSAGNMSAMPPEFWGKSFADELAASGSFQAVRFVYSPSEIRDEAFLVDGVLKKAVFAATWQSANEILVSFKATRGADRKVVWEREIGASWINPKEDYYCGASAQCVTDRLHVHWNREISGVFAQARADLVETLSSLSKSGTEGGAGDKSASQPAPESVDRTIEKILKGK